MLNKVMIIGRLGKDPECRFTQNGTAVANFSAATTEKIKGEDKTEWHDIILFGKLAEIAGAHLQKGSLVYIEGRLQTRKWQDKDGKDRYTTEIVWGTLKFLSGKGEGRGNRQEQQDEQQAEYSDDIPF